MGRTLEDMDIHSPSLRNVPKSKTAESLNELLEEKVVLESTLNELNIILERHGVDMSTPLIDPQGFPRSDIDVAQIRTVRAQVIRMRNDHKDLMLRIEKGLHALHQENRNAVEAQPTPTAPTTVAPQLIPFAIVNSVAVSSPAADAGLLKDDQIVKFGTVHYNNNAKLAKVAEVVQSSEGRAIDVVVLRDEVRVSIRLTPRSGWGGRGTLGCHLLPL